MKKIILIFIGFLFVNSLSAQSFNEMKKSAEQGDAEAQYNLGNMYQYGEGTLTDKKQAAYWIKKAYENGYEDAKLIWDDYELYKY